MDEEVGPVLEHGGAGAHASVRRVDAPTLAGGIARPYERDRAPVARRGAKASDRRLAHDRGRSHVLETDAVEDVLSGRQVFDQRLGGEVALRQGVDEQAARIL